MEDPATLASLGGWPMVTIDRSSHSIIRHAYEQVLDSCARLASFATGHPPTTEGPVGERQEFLAVDDLVSFGIHARRLIENTAGSKRFSNISILSNNSSKKVPLRIWRIINVLVHHSDVKIVRTTFHLLLLGGASIEELAPLMVIGSPDNKSFPPLVGVRSEKEKYIIFKINELIDIFQKEILVPIVDLCSEQNLFLDDQDI